MLRAAPQWKHLERLLEAQAQAEYDRLGAGLAYDEYLAAVGAYQVARRTVELVDTILDKVKDTDDRARQSDALRDDHRRSIFVSTPLWR